MLIESEARLSVGEKSRGRLMVIGGGEDRQGECRLLRQLARYAGGSQGHMIILPTASRLGYELGKDYQELFEDFGLGKVEVMAIENRYQAQDEKKAEKLSQATAIFFTGGDQLRISSILGGTPIDRALQTSFQKGALLAGTSAGASVMSDTMIVEGLDEKPPLKCTVKMAPGLGLLEEVVIDQHFAQRGRLGRLLMAVAQNPYVIGLGLDEDTAVLINDKGQLEVMGSQTALIIDGSEAEYSNVSEAYAEDPLTFMGVKIHVLSEGYGYDLNRRAFLLPKARI